MGPMHDFYNFPVYTPGNYTVFLPDLLPLEGRLPDICQFTVLFAKLLEGPVAKL